MVQGHGANVYMMIPRHGANVIVPQEIRSFDKSCPSQPSRMRNKV
jgi:hypothetical protein